MAKDPAFLFYPGDYLRDTQNLSEKSQVAYDRIMCEHMRNICISQQQLHFFTKRLSPEEVSELMMVLTQIDGGYQIEWVALSIEKRKSYSQSRSDNRKGKVKEDIKITSKSYVTHMVNENAIENVIGLDEIKKEVSNHKIWLESFCMSHHVDEPDIIRHLDKFILHHRKQGKETSSIREFKTYFANWSRLNPPTVGVSGGEFSTNTIESA
jgi:hypothetical protein